LTTFKDMIESILLETRNQSYRGIFHQLKSLNRTYTKISMPSEGDIPTDSISTIAKEGNPSPTNYKLRTTNVRKTDDQVAASNQSGVRYRKMQQGNQQRFSEEPQNKWIIVCLPNEMCQIVEHIDVMESNDDITLFRQIRNKYKERRSIWRRLLKLRNFQSIQLVKVRTLNGSLFAIFTSSDRCLRSDCIKDCVKNFGTVSFAPVPWTGVK
jgi:hypothetical protein